jgi:hypothetical protein
LPPAENLLEGLTATHDFTKTSRWRFGLTPADRENGNKPGATIRR